MIKKDGLFGSVTITDATDEIWYCKVECPECAALRTRIRELEKVAEAVKTYLLGSKHICPDDCSSYNELSAALRALREKEGRK